MSVRNEYSAGCCSCYPMSKQDLQTDINKSNRPRTSDLFSTCNLPLRFEYPHWFNGYGCQTNIQHPLYTTTQREYGYYPPGCCFVPHMYFPRKSRFNTVGGNYRSYSLNVSTNEIIFKTAPATLCKKF